MKIVIIEPLGITPEKVEETAKAVKQKRKEGERMITYSDLIQTGIFIVALIGLCYTIFKGRK